MKAWCGHEPGTGLYYERVGDPGDRPPVLFIHGGGATGACFRATPDGRAGWADLLGAAGYHCWVTDWPGTGRSGNRDPRDVRYDDVVAGYRALVKNVIGEPVVVVCHSMGGAVAWQLVAHEPDLVAGVVAVAAAYPANLAARSQVLEDDGDVVLVRFADTGVINVVDRRTVNFYGDDYIEHQALATSTRFPRAWVGQLRASLVGLPPRMLLQRMGVLDGLPAVADPAGFARARIRLVTGGEDPAHTWAIETRTVELLRSWGADAQLVWLPDLGIEGNGHFLFYEENSEQVLDVVRTQIDLVGVAEVAE